MDLTCEEGESKRLRLSNKCGRAKIRISKYKEDGNKLSGEEFGRLPFRY